MRQIRFVDWFAGIGGFRYGLEKANKARPAEANLLSKGDCPNIGDANRWASYSYYCVGACEVDKWCRQTYKRNFGHEPEWADSRAVDPSELPDFDLFCAGFPCQSFSIAGKRRGFRDIRGTLFFEIIRICSERRPKYLLLENVKGLLSVDNGFTFETILSSLSDIGYDLQWEVLNSKHFGVPQNRERVFIIGHLRDLPRLQVFPLGEADPTYQEPIREGRVVTSAITTENAHQFGKNVTARQAIDIAICDMYNRKFRANQDIAGALKGEGIADTSIGTALLEGGRIRRLTPLECERLQGFPDGWTEGVSDTQRYRMCGNAVTTTVVTAIGVRFLEVLMESG